MGKMIDNEFDGCQRTCTLCGCVCVCVCALDACIHVCVCERGRVSEWVFVCNHVRQAVMNGVFETERSVEFLGLDQIGNRKTNIR